MWHTSQSCVVKVRYIDEVITSWLHEFCDFDCKCSCVYAISSVYLFLVESGGLVHVRNRYNTKSLFVLEHVVSLKSDVRAAYHTVVYQECSHTTNPTSDHT